ncbi:unnamed protein product [Blepharisma stoltei]|uniref:Uncharacterized protein n=1 Tax=Blepharisma stoltei TaxID=1481888 RepID=A0AAU9IPE8_9CILI|nr:unnamed protein product [Blepharisma stoltei]
MKLKILLLIFLIPLNALLEDEVIETTPELLCQACKAKIAECGTDAECYKEVCNDNTICERKEGIQTQAEKIYQESEKKIKNGYKENVEPLVMQAEEKLGKTWDQTKEKSKSFVESSKEFAGNVYENVKKFVKPNFTESLCEACRKENIECDECIREKCKGDEECLKGFYEEEIIPKTEQLMEGIQNEVKAGFEKVKQQLPSNKDINEKAKGFTEKVKDFAEDASEKIKETVEPVIEGGKKIYKDFAEDAGGKIKETMDPVIEGGKKIYSEKIEPTIKDLRDKVPQPNASYIVDEAKDRVKTEIKRRVENVEQTLKRELGLYFGIPTILLMVLVAVGAYFIVKRKKVHTA